MSHEVDPRVQFAWEEGVRAIDRQASNLDEVRSRGAAVLGAASLAAAFLGAAILDQPGELGSAMWWGIGAFCLVGLSTVLVLWPRRGWKLSRDPAQLLENYVEGDEPLWLGEMVHELAVYLQGNVDANAKKLRWLYWSLSAGCVALVVEVVAFLLELRSLR